ncbi:MAG TPA: hypothetical protein VNT01_09430 [Symbiobacteriaceae bacterium]|nr:hypothetical protein [Symbiobacteriaceae bacterium]
MWMGLILIAWGLWCLVRAPGLAARRRHDAVPPARQTWVEHDEPLCSPMEWRAMGILWLLLGIGALIYAH